MNNQICIVQANDGRRALVTQSSDVFALADNCASYFDVLETNDGKALLRSAHGTYLSARPDATVASVPAASGWEAFEVEDGRDGARWLRARSTART
jgi:hypothetical protein